MFDAILDVYDVLGLEDNGLAMVPLVDDGRRLLAVEGDDRMSGSKSATEVEGDKGPDSTCADDVDAHRAESSSAGRWRTWRRAFPRRPGGPFSPAVPGTTRRSQMWQVSKNRNVPTYRRG